MNISGIRSLSEIPGLWDLWNTGRFRELPFFANSGMSVYHIYDKKVSVAGMGDVSFDEVLSSKQFRKIFVMLGINELGYPMNSTVKKYAGLIETLRQRQPDAVIYIEANLHVTQKRSAQDAIYNNANIDLFNQEDRETGGRKTDPLCGCESAV